VRVRKEGKAHTSKKGRSAGGRKIEGARKTVKNRKDARDRPGERALN